MEQLLGIIVFGALIAVCVIGLQRSRKAGARTGADAFAMTGGSSAGGSSAGGGSTGARSAAGGATGAGSAGGSAGSSPGRKTEDHATLSETTEPKSLQKDKVTRPATTDGDVGEQRPQAERPLGTSDPKA